MKPRTYIRLLLLMLVLSVSIILFAYSHKTSSPGQKDPDCSEKCSQNKAQTEFVLWESLSRSLLTVSH
ncbi:MAG: hypothetical protein Q8927_05155 [Bacteroidota bacterium]|nr:hypothetical protein [Bacteroidota bacterium]MDP4215568.1 hypothetical protein [Bacteroidota bacterium]MDP4244764.1 hypothetical protein [Bacteroidota bacterium]MDP4253747.1 hypothetical protein [Bacteroidota bacterium]MDP4258216.1 hypothetical protein [Bacteroidota bacterium]